MARKDVDLVIRAKDEAAKVVEQITKSLTEFANASKGVEASSGKTDNALTALGAAIGKLDKQLDGLAQGNKLADQLNKAGAAVARLETKMDSSRASAVEQRRELTLAGEAATKYASKLKGAEAALEKQGAAVKRASAGQKELAAAYETASSAQTKAISQQGKLRDQISKQAAALAEAKARYEELEATIRGTIEPSASLAKQFEASGRNVDKLEQRVTRLSGELAASESTSRAAGSAMAIFGAQAQKSAGNLAKQETILDKIKQNYDGLKVSTASAASAVGRLDKAMDSSNSVLAKQADELSRAEAGYVDLALSAGKADAVMAQFANSALADLSRELKQQKRSTLEAKVEWNLAERNVKELANSMRGAVAPSAELNRSFDAAVARARAAKQEYLANATALDSMGNAFREAGQDMQSIDQSARKIAEATNKLNKELGEVDARASKAARSLKQTDDVAQRHTGSVNRLAAAYRSFYGDTRKSLGLLQRIRGEVLGLVAAYGGLYAGIEVIKGAISATETLAGVSSRLNVAFGGDEGKAAAELDFIRREAERLGVTFTTLATEYSQFAVATKGTNLEGERTRKIFIGIAEAARVNRASQDDLQGVFKALTQIVSKGAVQLEELKGQLGDRLPGALQIMADSLGITTAELVKMTEAGELTSDALIPFAERVQSLFGPGLEEATSSAAASIARLGNAAFEALGIFSKGGFIDGFQNFVDTLTEVLRSSDFEAFAQRAGAAMGQLFDILSFGAENFQTLIAVATAFLALRLTPLVIAIGGAFLAFGQDVLVAGKGLIGFSAATQTAAGRTAAMTLAVGRLRVALATLLGTTGIGLLVAAVGAGIALWATEADGATEALNLHRKIVDSVKNAYDAAGKSVDGWADRIGEATFSQAAANFDKLKNELASVRKAATDILVPVSGNAESRSQIRELIGLFRDGGISADAYKRALEEVANSDPLVDRASIVALQDAADGTLDLEKGALEAQAAMILLASSSSAAAKQAAAEVLGLGDALGEAADKAAEAASKAEQFENAMTELRDRIPEVKRELEYLEDSKAIEGFLLQSLQAASTWGQIAEAIRAAGGAMSALNKDFAEGIDGLGSASTGVEAAAILLRKSEGFRETPYYDVNAYRVGYGSDTITLSDGTIKKVTQGMRVSVEDANRDLLRRISTEFLPKARDAVGADNFNKLLPAQQAVLTSLAYNFGSLPNSVAEAVRSGMSDSGIATVIRNLGAGSHSGTKIGEGLIKRRNEEAAIFESGVGGEDAIERQAKLEEEKVKDAEKAAEERAKEAQSTKDRIADGEFEISQQELKNQGLERQAAIEDAIREAKAENPNISAAELEAIKQQAGALFDKQQIEKNSLTDKEKAAEAEEKVNNLLATRNELEAQRQIALKEGDTEKSDELKTKIMELNEQLLLAIDNATAMWAAVGGEAADLAIAKLASAKIEAQAFSDQGKQTKVDWSGVSELFAGGLTNAFDSFSRAVAEGQSVGEAARNAFLQFASDFLREIAQMIIKQAILNALKAAFGGTGFGALIGIGAGHTGGLVGSSRVGSGNRTRRVDPGMFAAAGRYHQGGMIGLAPNEVPIIAKKGEEMLTEDDPRHMLNGGGAGGEKGGKNTNLRVINAIDSASVLEAAMAGGQGTEIFVNWMRANKESIISTLELD